MVNLITKTTALLQKVNTWYEQRNSEQAVRALYGRQRYLAGIFNGINTFLDLFSKYGAVITLALSIASFVGLSITPVGWIVIGSVMLLGAVVIAGYSVYTYLNNSKKIISALETKEVHEIKITSLMTEIETQYAQSDGLQQELELLQKYAEYLGISPDVEIQSPPPAPVEIKPVDNAPPNAAKENRFIRALKKIGTYAAMPFIALGHLFIKLAHLLKLDQLKELIYAAIPIQKRINEFIAIAAFVTTAFTGLFMWVSSLIAGGATQLSFAQSFTLLVGALNPIGLAITGGTFLLISASVLLNKIFFKDPHEYLTTKLAQEREGLIDNLNQNQLLLSQIENKSEELQEKIRLLTIKITVKLQDTLKDSECEKRREIEGNESSERFDLFSTFKDILSTLSKDEVEKKFTGNIHSLKQLILGYQAQLGKLQMRSALEEHDRGSFSGELNPQELILSTPSPAGDERICPNNEESEKHRICGDERDNLLLKFGLFKTDLRVDGRDTPFTLLTRRGMEG